LSAREAAAWRWIGGVLSGVGLLGVLALLAAYETVRASLPDLDDHVATAGLSADVTIERDRRGIPTIDAASRTDAAFATGFAHAQDRYFQMDLTRRMASGRLAELFGDVALEADRGHRRHRFAAVADAVLAALPAEHRAVLDAYTAGVNAGLERLASRPFEYWLLRARPEPWSPRDSLLVVFAMYLKLNDADASLDLQRGLIYDALPRALAEFVYSVAPEWEAPIDGQVAAAMPIPTVEQYDLRGVNEALVPVRLGMPAVPPGRSAAATFGNRAVGSNNWAMAGARTRSGAALVANDMHLGLAIPNTWYRVRLQFRNLAQPDLCGVTLPGAPNLIAGSNGRIAWGFTNSYGDFSDLVLVDRSANGSQYRTAMGWQPLEHHVETIASASGRRERFDVVSTQWGPLLPDTYAGRSLALNWTAQHPEATNLRWLDLERAISVEAALALAPTLGGPVQNFVVGDAQGHIGWTLLGRLPRRGSGYDPTRPADWTLPDSGWNGWLDGAEYPRVYDPPSGQIWTANTRVVGGAALALIGDGSADRGARARQIRDDLEALRDASPDDMLRVQLDDRALYLAPTQRRLVALLDAEAAHDSPRREEFRDLVAGWNARASAGSVGYRLVRTYRVALERETFEMLVRAARAAHPGAAFQVPAQFARPVDELLEHEPPHLLGPPYQSWRGFELAVLDAVLGQLAADCPKGLARCRWGDYNLVTMRHPLSGALPVFRQQLEMPPVPTSGDNDMPRVHLPGFGASERFAVSPGHEADAYLHMPGGQSGHPLSPFYRAGHKAWLEGRPTAFLPGPARYRQVLSAE
jgi:penicillin amidase